MRGQGRVFDRGEIPWIAYCQNGRELRESAAPAIQALERRKKTPLTRNEAQAVAHELLQRRLREVDNDREGIKPFVGPQQYRVTVGELLDDLEADVKLRRVGAWKGFCLT